MSRRPKRYWGVGLALFHCAVIADIGYSQQELQALKKREALSHLTTALDTPQPAPNAPRAPFIEYARQHTQRWQQKLSSAEVQGIIEHPATAPNPHSAPTGVMVFVSLTMPESSLKALLAQSEIWSVPLVIRGVLPEGFGATATKIHDLLERKQSVPIRSGFAIHPEWFKTFDIQEVPTFVAVKPGRCLPKQPCSQSDYDIVKGNVSLPDALAHLARGDNPDIVLPILKRSMP